MGWGTFQLHQRGESRLHQLTQREFLFLEDLLHSEQLEVMKFRDFAQHVQDPQLKQMCEQMAGRHQQHFERLYQILSQSKGEQTRAYGTTASSHEPYQQQTWTGAPSQGGFPQ